MGRVRESAIATVTSSLVVACFGLCSPPLMSKHVRSTREGTSGRILLCCTEYTGYLTAVPIIFRIVLYLRPTTVASGALAGKPWQARFHCRLRDAQMPAGSAGLSFLQVQYRPMSRSHPAALDLLFSIQAALTMNRRDSSPVLSGRLLVAFYSSPFNDGSLDGQGGVSTSRHVGVDHVRLRNLAPHTRANQGRHNGQRPSQVNWTTWDGAETRQRQ